MKLKGRRILITGAASGIGAATAKLFHQEGAALTLLDRDGERLRTFKASVEAGDGSPQLHALDCDIAESMSVDRAVAAGAAALGGLDGLVLSAGVDLLKPFPEMNAAEWQHVLDVNLSGPFNVCHAALPFLKDAGSGTIIPISSGAGLTPIAHRTAYCASKAGLVMFGKALAIDLAPFNIRVNAICPGAIDTPLFQQSLTQDHDQHTALEKVLDRYLIKRLGRPEDIAKVALFLTSQDSAHMTGTALAVDGGRTFH